VVRWAEAGIVTPAVMKVARATSNMSCTIVFIKSPGIEIKVGMTDKPTETCVKKQRTSAPVHELGYALEADVEEERGNSL
jgi:hypothetical protein